MQTTERRLTKAQKDYEGFVAKFEREGSHTTDDCLTPPHAYAAALDWLTERRPDLSGRKIVRPFFPGGDFENHAYPRGCAVVDNPPFSMYARVVRFFLKRGIDFFLFAPGLTLFVDGVDCCYIPVGYDLTYANGAHISTSFVTNMLPGRLMLAPSLRQRLRDLDPNARVERKKSRLPARMWTPARLGSRCKKLSNDIVLGAGNCSTPSKKGACAKAFGGGVILSERAERMMDAYTIDD